MRTQLFGRNRNNLSIAPDIQWQSFPRVLFNDSFNRRFQRHQRALFQRQFENI